MVWTSSFTSSFSCSFFSPLQDPNYLLRNHRGSLEAASGRWEFGSTLKSAHCSTFKSSDPRSHISLYRVVCGANIPLEFVKDSGSAWTIDLSYMSSTFGPQVMRSALFGSTLHQCVSPSIGRQVQDTVSHEMGNGNEAQGRFRDWRWRVTNRVQWEVINARLFSFGEGPLIRIQVRITCLKVCKMSLYHQ